MYIVVSEMDNYKQSKSFDQLEKAVQYIIECAQDNEYEILNADRIANTVRGRENEKEVCLYDTRYDNRGLLISNLILLKI